jgi:hypothetical protein
MLRIPVRIHPSSGATRTLPPFGALTANRCVIRTGVLNRTFWTDRLQLAVPGR